MNGSHTTGQASSTPWSRASAAMSSGVVTGVIRSTMESGNATSVAMCSARSSSVSRAKDTSIRRAT